MALKRGIVELEDYNSNWPHDFDYGGGIVPPSKKKITVRFYNKEVING